MSIQRATISTRLSKRAGRAIVIIVALLAGVGAYCLASAVGASDTIQTGVAFFVPVLVVEGGWAYRRHGQRCG